MTQIIVSDRSNASRKAKLMIANGEAPASQFIIEKRGEREYEVVWLTGGEAPVDQLRSLCAEEGLVVTSAHTTQTDKPAPPPNSEPEPADHPRLVSIGFWAPATAPATPNSELATELAQVGAAKATKAAGKRTSKAAGRQAKAEARKARIQASLAAAAPPSGPSKAVKRGARGKYNAPAANGDLPPKPVITSATNQAYQRHIDALTELAEEGKWDEVAEYKLNKNAKQSYARILSQYHDRLIAFHINSLALA